MRLVPCQVLVGQAPRSAAAARDPARTQCRLRRAGAILAFLMREQGIPADRLCASSDNPARMDRPRPQPVIQVVLRARSAAF
jgi:hypothetical protein